MALSSGEVAGRCLLAHIGRQRAGAGIDLLSSHQWRFRPFWARFLGVNEAFLE